MPQRLEELGKTIHKHSKHLINRALNWKKNPQGEKDHALLLTCAKFGEE